MRCNRSWKHQEEFFYADVNVDASDNFFLSKEGPIQTKSSETYYRWTVSVFFFHEIEAKFTSLARTAHSMVMEYLFFIFFRFHLDRFELQRLFRTHFERLLKLKWAFSYWWRVSQAQMSMILSKLSKITKTGMALVTDIHAWGTFYFDQINKQ